MHPSAVHFSNIVRDYVDKGMTPVDAFREARNRHPDALRACIMSGGMSSSEADAFIAARKESRGRW